VNKDRKDMASRAAYKVTTDAIYESQSWKDPACIGTNLVENLLHERAYSLDHFEYDEQKKQSSKSKLTEKEATESILKHVNDLKKKQLESTDENRIKKEIDQLVSKYTRLNEGKGESHGSTQGEVYKSSGKSRRAQSRQARRSLSEPKA